MTLVATHPFDGRSVMVGHEATALEAGSIVRFKPAPPPGERLSIVEWCELQAWRKLAGRLQHVVEVQLQSAPDGAPSDLIALQHDLVALRQAPFGGPLIPQPPQDFP